VETMSSEDEESFGKAHDDKSENHFGGYEVKDTLFNANEAVTRMTAFRNKRVTQGTIHAIKHMMDNAPANSDMHTILIVREEDLDAMEGLMDTSEDRAHFQMLREAGVIHDNKPCLYKMLHITSKGQDRYTVDAHTGISNCYIPGVTESAVLHALIECRPHLKTDIISDIFVVRSPNEITSAAELKGAMRLWYSSEVGETEEEPVEIKVMERCEYATALPDNITHCFGDIKQVLGIHGTYWLCEHHEICYLEMSCAEAKAEAELDTLIRGEDMETGFVQNHNEPWPDDENLEIRKDGDSVNSSVKTPPRDPVWWPEQFQEEWS